MIEETGRKFTLIIAGNRRQADQYLHANLLDENHTIAVFHTVCLVGLHAGNISDVFFVGTYWQNPVYSTDEFAKLLDEIDHVHIKLSYLYEERGRKSR